MASGSNHYPSSPGSEDESDNHDVFSTPTGSTYNPARHISSSEQFYLAQSNSPSGSGSTRFQTTLDRFNTNRSGSPSEPGVRYLAGADQFNLARGSNPIAPTGSHNMPVDMEAESENLRAANVSIREWISLQYLKETDVSYRLVFNRKSKRVNYS